MIFANSSSRNGTPCYWVKGFSLMRLTNKLLARKRAMVETVIDQLKNIS
jgi:hypothetical protein